jgi:FkbM family methyltransferase
VEGGNQPVTSYDLTNLTTANFEFIEKALWNCQEVVNFYSPPNIEYVSHSIGNWQGGFSKTGKHIKVETITLKDIVDQYDLHEIELVKFDIEGAEIEVIEQMIQDNIFPKQILVEYDELQVGNDYSKQRHFRVNSLLLNNGYEVGNIDNTNNYTYIKKI